MNAIYLDYIGATLNSLPKVNSNLLLYLLDFLKEVIIIQKHYSILHYTYFITDNFT